MYAGVAWLHVSEFCIQRVDPIIALGGWTDSLSATMQMEGLFCCWREAIISRVCQRAFATHSKPSSEASLCMKLIAVRPLSRRGRLMR